MTHLTNGDSSGAKNKRKWQVVRHIAPSSGEIIYDWIVPGHFVAENVIKQTIEHFEFLLSLSTPKQRQRFIKRRDSGFGSDACINGLMSRGYHLLTFRNRGEAPISWESQFHIGKLLKSKWKNRLGGSESRNSQTVCEENQAIGPTIPKTRGKVVLSRSGHESLGLGKSKSHSNG